jgi:very-short-patch-repair endonuclease
MTNKISLDEIKNRLYNLYGEKYEYDFSNFINTHSKIGVKCKIHGWNNQILKNLFKGHECNKCGEKIAGDKQRGSIENALIKFNKAHGNRYDYSKFIYTDRSTPSIIICKIHGEFKQSPYTHSKGHGCPSCSGNKKMNTNEFIIIADKIHNKKYSYDLVDYKNMKSEVMIICDKHGEFSQVAQTHITGSGCPKCNQSKGEKMIEIFLADNEISYITQNKFDDCKYVNHLIFDFYLPDYNTCIEFNGIQHYYPIDIFGGEKSLEINRKRDKIKEEYCKSNGIKLIVIKQDKKHIDIKDVQNQIDNIKNNLTSNFL